MHIIPVENAHMLRWLNYWLYRPSVVLIIICHSTHLLLWILVSQLLGRVLLANGLR